jgi:putative OPT family oligopeptide transporter
VGYIIGLNIAVLVLIGGIISWGIAIPIYSSFFMGPAEAGVDAADLAYSIWSNKIRYLGVGAMLVGGFWALASISGPLVSAISFKPRNTTLPATEHDAPMSLVLLGIFVLLIPMFALYQETVQVTSVAITLTVVMTVAGFLFSSVGGYMAGLIGSSSNPVSGMTIATITFASLLLLWLIGPTPTAAAAAILIGGVVCCAAAIGGDNLQDLKAGYLLGATPWKQQVMQAVGVVSAVLVMAPILNLLLNAYGIGPASESHPESLAAPQATLMAAVAKGVLGGSLPWGIVGAGAAIGMTVIAIDEWLRMAGANFRMPVLAVALGLYLPLELSVPIALGGLVAWLAHRGRNSVRGVLVAAGLITGEALIGIFIAVPIVMTGDTNVLTIENLSFGPLAGLAITLAIAAGLFRVARQSS